MMKIDRAVAELFRGLRGLLRDIFVRLGPERRAERRREFHALLEYGHMQGLDAEALADYAAAIGDRRSARALRRLARTMARAALPSPAKDAPLRLNH